MYRGGNNFCSFVKFIRQDEGCDGLHRQYKTLDSDTRLVKLQHVMLWLSGNLFYFLLFLQSRLNKSQIRM
jgi:hypothetical protein